MILQPHDKHVYDHDYRRRPWPWALGRALSRPALPASPGAALESLCWRMYAGLQSRGWGWGSRIGVVSSAGVWSLAAALLFTAFLQLLGARAGVLGSEPSCPSPHPSALGKLETPLEFCLPHSSQHPQERQLPGPTAILPKGCCCEPLAADTHSGCWSGCSQPGGGLGGVPTEFASSKKTSQSSRIITSTSVHLPHVPAVCLREPSPPRHPSTRACTGELARRVELANCAEGNERGHQDLFNPTPKARLRERSVAGEAPQVAKQTQS